MSPEQIWSDLLEGKGDSEALLAKIREYAETSQAPAEVSFGTSGWRGELGIEFTLRNVQVVAQGIVEMYRTADAELFAHLGIKDFAELQSRGLVIGHDNRFLGPEFARVVNGVFRQAGVKTYYVGEASTPEYSAVVEEKGLACAVNLTPSHNPANYAGIKFNPSDGGPAGPEITNVITRLSNELMVDWEYKSEWVNDDWELLDALELYQNYLKRKKTIDLDLIQSFVSEGDVLVVTDHVHGSTRKRPDAILGANAKLQTLRTDDNYLFGGIAPEPSSANMQGVMAALKASEAKYKVGVIFDPDGDRVRFTDGEVEISMNYFGAMALHYLHEHRNIRGVLAKSVATSNFANAIAEKLNIPIEETAVGFKNFRPFTAVGADPMAIVAFEESDGISGYNNTIEKDAQFGLLLAIEMVARLNKNLGDYLKELQEEFGYFFPERSGFSVDKSLVGAPLMNKVTKIGEGLSVGAEVPVGSGSKKVKELLTLDGVKVIFEDDSWMLVRPSGTEPKVRIYAECRLESEKDDMFAAAQQLFENA